MAGALANGVPACPVDKPDCRTRSQAKGDVFNEISISTTCCDATRRRVQGWLGSKEVAYLLRLLSNDGLDHGGRDGAARLVAQAPQAAQEAASCGLPLRPLSGRGPHFSAGDGPAALSGCSERVVTTAPLSRATMPSPQRARVASGSSTWVWHACSAVMWTPRFVHVYVARSWSDSLIGHRCMVL